MRCLPVGPDLTEAFATVNGSAFTRLERDFRFSSALCADRREHLAGLETIAVVTGPFRFSCLPARRATLGFVGVALGLEKFLLRSAENEGGAAIDTL